LNVQFVKLSEFRLNWKSQLSVFLHAEIVVGRRVGEKSN
jgi:hypothetical protein